MRCDPRIEVERKAQAVGPGVELVVRARESFLAEEIVTRLFSVDFDELCDLAGLDHARRGELRGSRDRYVFSNGWQSWSFGGELGPKERIKPAWLIEGLNTYVFRPGPREARGELLSHFFTHLRSGSDRLVLLSLGPESGRAGAPVAFRISRETLAASAEVQARGTSYRRGEIVARVVCALVEGFFGERDFFKSWFGGDGRFDRLAFLGSGDSLVPGGYESWYNHYTAITEEIILSDLAAISSGNNLINKYYIGRGKPTVFQIDDGWERSIGDWRSSEEKFPGGMAALASSIEAAGLVPGLWVAPLIVEKDSAAALEHPEWLLRDDRGRPVVAGWNNQWSGDFHAWDLSVPEASSWLESLFDRIVEEWGYRYLKLDFLYAGLLEGARKHGGAAWEHYERIISRITSRTRNSRGAPVAWLGCGAPLESSYRHFPLMRIGADTKEVWDDHQGRLVRHHGRPAAKLNLLATLGRSLLDGSVFVNDPDVVFCRTGNVAHGDREKELIAAAARMFASQIMFSDDAESFADPEVAALTERLVALFDRLDGHEFGATRIGRNLFLVEEREGRIRGWINLGNRARRVADGSPVAMVSGDLPFHARRVSGGWLLEPRSISLLAARSD